MRITHQEEGYTALQLDEEEEFSYFPFVDILSTLLN